MHRWSESYRDTTAAECTPVTTASGSCRTCGPMAIPRGGFILIGPPMLGCPKRENVIKADRLVKHGSEGLESVRMLLLSEKSEVETRPQTKAFILIPLAGAPMQPFEFESEARLLLHPSSSQIVPPTLVKSTQQEVSCNINFTPFIF